LLAGSIPCRIFLIALARLLVASQASIAWLGQMMNMNPYGMGLYTVSPNCLNTSNRKSKSEKQLAGMLSLGSRLFYSRGAFAAFRTATMRRSRSAAISSKCLPAAISLQPLTIASRNSWVSSGALRRVHGNFNAGPN